MPAAEKYQDRPVKWPGAQEFHRSPNTLEVMAASDWLPIQTRPPVHEGVAETLDHTASDARRSLPGVPEHHVRALL